MNEAIIVALIVSVISPTLLVFVTSWQRRKEKLEDYAREDEVARILRKSSRLTVEKLDILVDGNEKIHTLVNQKLTNVTERALASTSELLNILKEQAQYYRDLGIRPSEEHMERIHEEEMHVAELVDNLEDRAEQQAIVNHKDETESKP